MIDSNLVFVRQFLEDNNLLQTVMETEKNWSSELRVRYSSRANQLIEADVSKDFVMRIKTKQLNKMAAKEKLILYILLRLLSIELHGAFSFFFVDFVEYLEKRSWKQNAPEEYLYYQELSDNMFCYEIDCKLTPGTRSRRNLYRMKNSKWINQSSSFEDFLYKSCFIPFTELLRPEPKKKIRHKGYRDHGALGSEYSQTLRQQASDYSLREAEEQRIKEKQDKVEFLLGLAGWI